MDKLRTLPDKCVNMIMTSPPYKSLRNYQTKPVVWDGDEKCKHEWLPRGFKLHAGRGDAQKSGKYSQQPPVPDAELTDATCKHCNGWLGELGLERDFQSYVRHLADIFDECKRVLRDDGSLWIVISDTYNGSGGAGGDYNAGGIKEGQPRYKQDVEKSMPPKTLMLIPERLAIKLVDRGWILRNKICWKKNNCMPSSAKDRMTVDFEFVYFLTKKPNYFFNTQYEPYQTSSLERAMRGNSDKHKLVNGVPGQSAHSFHKPRPNVTQAFAKYVNTEYKGQATKDYDSAKAQNPSDTKRRILASMRRNFDANTGVNNKEPYQENNPHRARLERDGGYDKMPPIGGVKKAGGNNATYSGNTPEWSTFGRLKRAVWTVNTQALSQKHYAAYPEKLVEVPLNAACPAQVCKTCGEPRKRIMKSVLGYGSVDSDTKATDGTAHNMKRLSERRQYYRSLGYESTPYAEIGWTKCSCVASQEYEPGIVLDPFLGAGTTALVALKQGKSFIGIEIQPDFVDIAKKRIAQFMPKVQEVNNWHP